MYCIYMWCEGWARNSVMFLRIQCPPQSFPIVESSSWKHFIQVNHFRSWWNTLEQVYRHPSFLQLQLHKGPYDWCPHSSQTINLIESWVNWLWHESLYSHLHMVITLSPLLPRVHSLKHILSIIRNLGPGVGGRQGTATCAACSSGQGESA